MLGVAALLLIPPSHASLSTEGRQKLFDQALFAGPVGLLALTEIASSLVYLTFASIMPLWLVSVHGVARDSALSGWTLATFSLAAAVGGIIAGLLAPRVGRRLLVAGTMLPALLALFALFHLEPINHSVQREQCRAQHASGSRTALVPMMVSRGVSAPPLHVAR